MPTSAATRNFAWGDGLQVAAQDLRLETISALTSGLGGPSSNPLGIGSGVRDGTGNPMQVAVSTGLSVTVNTGVAVIQGSAAANAGAYSCCLDTVATLTCAAADLVNPRIDAVIVQVVDNGNNTSAATVNIVTGTPAGAPSPPSLPANSLALCYITVPANATSLVSGNLSDQRRFLAAAGGIQPVLSSSLYPTSGPLSAYAHDLSTGRLRKFNGSTLVPPRVAAFAPVSSSVTSNITFPAGSPGTLVTIASVSVTVDGSTELRITCRRPGLFMTTPVSGASLNNSVNVDGTLVDSWFEAFPSGIPSSVSCLPLTMVSHTTPAAGTHTITWKAQTASSSQAMGFQAGSTAPVTLRVEAVSP